MEINSFGSDDILSCAQQCSDKIRQTVQFMSLDKNAELDNILMLSVAVLRQARNQSQPVNRLPPEILTIIFQRIASLVSAICKSKCGDPCRHRTHDNAVVPLSHVCRYWRSVALSTPHLWRQIVVRRQSVELLKTSVERSRNVPLTVELDGSGWSDDRDWLWQLLQAQRHRIEEIVCKDDENLSGPSCNMAQCLTFSAPALKKLTVAHVWKGFPKAGSLFAGCAPQLRSFCGCDSSHLPRGITASLTSVHISDCTMRLVTLMEWLRSCPQLEHLSLKDAFSNFDSRPLEKGPVRLPRLHRLYMQSSPSDAEAFFAKVSLPSTTSVQLGVWNTSIDDSENMPSLTHFPLGEPTQLAFIEHQTNLGLIAADQSRTVFVREVDCVIDTPLPSLISPDRALTFVRDIWIIDEGCRADSRIGSMLHSLRAIPAATSLTIDSGHPRTYLARLTANIDDHNAPLLPALSSVRICNIRRSKDVLNVIVFAKARAELGFPIASLHISYRPGYDGPILDRKTALKYVQRIEVDTLGARPDLEFPVDRCSCDADHEWQPWKSLWGHMRKPCSSETWPCTVWSGNLPNRQ
ncbi:hypothetical protein CERSUDRAFT_123754 [Gelatoporia subvermispora B]|uniref:F-box domain-containing protein n=1 Tax=Ceriporiopsis subvermispora (strain B) TaxID=914234 RepID=M2RCW5_CERS8|nr:hypothetical protein CERSUDRAFT_123754 [Gelatoporia subvermispora B]